MTRQDANLAILQMLMTEVINQPEIRFGQLLQNMDAVTKASTIGGVWINEYYVEPEKVLQRMELRAIMNTKDGE